MDWSNRVAVVTGGASGIGQATVEEFARSGARVAIFDIQAERSQQLRDHLTAAGAHVDCYTVDVADAEACKTAAQAVFERWGRLDFLVNNAVSFIAKGLDVTTADWERCLGVNVRGYANMVQACYPFMKQVRGGAIVNIASISAHIAQPNRWTYNATKGAIVSMTKCQALDLALMAFASTPSAPAGHGRRKSPKPPTATAPNGNLIWGRYHMLRRLGEPREVARADALPVQRRCQLHHRDGTPR